MSPFRITPRLLIALLGLLWLGVGISLLTLGSSLILKGCLLPSPYSLSTYLSRTLHDPAQRAVILLTFALFIGYLKGRFVLSKVADKQANHFQALPPPLSIKHFFSKRLLILIGTMCLLGMSLQSIPFISTDVRGIIDVAVGLGLIRGAIQCGRRAFFPEIDPMNIEQ